MSGKEQQQSDCQIVEEPVCLPPSILWLINDDVNTFEFVIENLIELCGHTYEQAFQCALITHYRGKCDILEGNYVKLTLIAHIMRRRGLTAEVTT
ncbi:MAG: ATP-dependent Clp protease adaptor ClpS [Bacteroidales bacterium]|jgi:ATP-dependent Clp protease adaptor protein ClpS|nr:ATP-dependent Clp protease adaptor ClpS [Bacteroidales bacterium]